jgi:hypothetical protein
MTGEVFWSPPEDAWPDAYEEEWEIPSLGGPATFGSLVLHDLDRDIATVHMLQFELEPGWVPEDPWDSRWRCGPVGIEFRADDAIRLTLPDESVVDLSLPAPPVVPLPTPARGLPPYEAD